jgi:NADP-dependent 3-hydroxy acid dehydrogenase YdfG
MKVVIPFMRKSKKGKIICLSGRNTLPFQDMSSASHFAIEGLCESMAPIYLEMVQPKISLYF